VVVGAVMREKNKKKGGGGDGQAPQPTGKREQPPIRLGGSKRTGGSTPSGDNKLIPGNPFLRFLAIGKGKKERTPPKQRPMQKKEKRIYPLASAGGWHGANYHYSHIYNFSSFRKGRKKVFFGATIKNHGRGKGFCNEVPSSSYFTRQKGRKGKMVRNIHERRRKRQTWASTYGNYVQRKKKKDDYLFFGSLLFGGQKEVIKGDDRRSSLRGGGGTTILYCSKTRHQQKDGVDWFSEKKPRRTTKVQQERETCL